MSRNSHNPLFDPVSAEQFFADYWGKQRLFVQRGDPDYFHDFLTLIELDRLIASSRIPLSNFNLAQDNAPLPFDDYSVGGSFVHKAKALALHQAGATIILRSVEQWSPSLNRLRITAETAFKCAAQANVYLTPPGEKSTPPHWDTHDLFVLQIAGEKRWKIFGGECSLPLEDERFQVGVDVVSHDWEEIVLKPGDTLYLPRGVIHEPVAESYSVHVALGVHAVRWHDLVQTALLVAARRQGATLRQTVDGWADGDLFAAPQALLADVLDPATLAAAERLLRRQFEEDRAVDLDARLVDIQEGPRLAPETRYARRGGVAIDLQRTEAGVRITAGGRQVSVRPALDAAATYIMAHPSFALKELPTADASAEEGAALCAALHEIGVLTARLSPSSSPNA